ncbi:MAG: hypothetical protein WC483_00050 [Candidatus Paceibacterota bacterium]
MQADAKARSADAISLRRDLSLRPSVGGRGGQRSEEEKDSDKYEADVTALPE